MTLIAAMDCQDYLLMGADGEITDSAEVRFTMRKLSIASDQPGRRIAWGFCGDEGTGMAFGDWLGRYTWPPTASWASFAHAAGHELSRLNGERRARAVLAGASIGKNDTTNVILAGYVHGIRGVWELSDDGGVAAHQSSPLTAIGSGRAHAMIAMRTLEICSDQPVELGPTLLGALVEVVVCTAPMCGRPTRMLQITADRIADIESD